MLKLIIFDWDGTLADSVGKIIQCKYFLSAKYGLPFPSVDTIKNVLGTRFESAISRCFPTASEEVLSRLGEDFHILMQQPEYQARLFPETKKTLETLKKNGFRLAVATSKSKKEMDSAITHNKLSDIFELVCCGDEYPGKPDPTMLNHIMKKCDVGSEECVMIGDTTTDMMFAANAGIKAIAVTFGAHSIAKLRATNPDAFISEWIQLPAVLKAKFKTT